MLASCAEGVHHACGADEIAVPRVGGAEACGEVDVEMVGLHFFGVGVAVGCGEVQVVVAPEHDAGLEGGVEEPVGREDVVVAVAYADGEGAHVDAAELVGVCRCVHLGGVAHLESAPVEVALHDEGAGAAALFPCGVEDGGIGEVAAVEDVVACGGEGAQGGVVEAAALADESCAPVELVDFLKAEVAAELVAVVVERGHEVADVAEQFCGREREGEGDAAVVGAHAHGHLGACGEVVV